MGNATANTLSSRLLMLTFQSESNKSFMTQLKYNFNAR